MKTDTGISEQRIIIMRLYIEIHDYTIIKQKYLSSDKISFHAFLSESLWPFEMNIVSIDQMWLAQLSAQISTREDYNNFYNETLSCNLTEYPKKVWSYVKYTSDKRNQFLRQRQQSKYSRI